jgi:hypothetical protein
MHRLLAMLAVLTVASSLQGGGQESIVKRCEFGKPHVQPDDSQPIPSQLKIPHAPKTARHVGCFATFSKKSTMVDVVRKCGIPDKHQGSGAYIFVYYMADCSVVSIRTPDLQHLTINHESKRLMQ